MQPTPSLSPITTPPASSSSSSAIHSGGSSRLHHSVSSTTMIFDLPRPRHKDCILAFSVRLQGIIAPATAIYRKAAAVVQRAGCLVALANFQQTASDAKRSETAKQRP